MSNEKNLGPESSVEDLETALNEVNAQREELKDRARRLSGWLDNARARDEAVAKVAAMSDAEREALREALINR